MSVFCKHQTPRIPLNPKELMIVALLLVALSGGCRRWPQTPIITIVIPNGYQGRFEIVADHADGVAIPLEAGGYRLVIPASGVLRIKDDTPLYRWAKYRFVFGNGENAEARISRGYAIDPSRKTESGGTTTTHGDGSRTPFYLHYGDEFRKAELSDLVADLENRPDEVSKAKKLSLELFDAILRKDVAAVIGYFDPKGVLIIPRAVPNEIFS